jgi:hypothetical protein
MPSQRSGGERILARVDEASEFIDAVRREYRGLRALAERALAQVDDEAFVAELGAGDNSIAVLVKHVGGNLRSRWTEFRTTDGEKPDRQRDGEFEAAESRVEIEAIWERGWSALEEALGSLTSGDLTRTVHIRTQSLTATRALLRSLAHTAGHVYQIVQLAKHWNGHQWQTLSIPRGESERFARDMAARFGTRGKVPDRTSR